MLLIVNAEDLGGNVAINDASFALMEAGVVTSSTIIANGPAFEHAIAAIKQFPSCSFGVHLNLTVFPPLTASSGLAPVLDDDGCLSSKLFDVPMTTGLRDALVQELIAQVQRALDAGIPVSHLDSHQHIHTLPKLFPVLKTVQRRFGIRRMRSTINLLAPNEHMTALRSLKKRLFRVALRYHYATVSPEGLGEFRDFYAALKVGRIPQFQHLELMVHPGAPEAPYACEVDLLKSDWRRLLPSGIALGNYHSIA